MLSGAPFRREEGGRLVIDCRGEQVRLMGVSHDIMHELVTRDHFKGTKVAYVSRCDIPEWADDCMHLFEAAPGMSLRQLADYVEIYPGTKTKHFRAVSKASGIAFRDMLFFDNESRNIRDCKALGITSIYTPRGMTRRVWEEGLAEYARQAAARSPAGSHSPAGNGRGSPYGADSDEEDPSWN